MKKLFFALALLLSGIVEVAAQSVFDKIVVSEPKTMITAKNNFANIRTKPNAKAPLVKVKGWEPGVKYNLNLKNHEILAATDAGNGWWKTDRGYVSKTACKVVPKTAIPAEKLNKFPGGFMDDMDNYSYWRVGINKATGLALCEYNQDQAQLFIGREVEGTYVFTHNVNCTFNYDETARIDVKKNVDEEGKACFEITYGPAFAKKMSDENNEGSSFYYPDLGRLPAEVLEFLFTDRINDESYKPSFYNGFQDVPLYINGYLMSEQFYPYMPW